MTSQNEQLLKELDLIQSLIWARVHEELQKRGVKYSLGTAYGAGQSIKEVLHPRVKKLILSKVKEAREEGFEEGKKAEQNK